VLWLDVDIDLVKVTDWKMLWNGNECEKNKSNENFKTTIHSKNYDRPKTTKETFKYLGSILTNDGRCISEINVGLLWLKLHSTRRGLFLLAHWTWN
jgi:hypothetical protein